MNGAAEWTFDATLTICTLKHGVIGTRYQRNAMWNNLWNYKQKSGNLLYWTKL